MGPITLFDKSFLQSLSLDESVWFDNFFLTNISPLFFAETLADLAKSTRPGCTPEKEVSTIAQKTPEMQASANVFHIDLCIANLHGQEIAMDGRIVLAKGVPLKTADKRGVLFKSSPEMEALARWRDGDFRYVERNFAAIWRRSVENIDLRSIGIFLNSIGMAIDNFRSLEEARNAASAFIEQNSSRIDFFKLALLALNIPERFFSSIFKHWERNGKPPFDRFAPYASYILTIIIFFHMALESALISQQKASNRIDLAYLFYLPFCMLFVSSDHFHRRCAPLFLRDNQEFIWGEDLKKDLGRINKYFDKLPEEDKQKGIYSIAVRPPTDEVFLVAKIWDRFFPNWRKRDLSFTPKKDSRLIQEIENFAKATFTNESQLNQQFLNPDAMIVERQVRKKKGSWWLVPRDLNDKK